MQMLERAASTVDRRAYSNLIVFSPLRNTTSVNALLRIISEESYEGTRSCAYQLLLCSDQKDNFDENRYLVQALAKIKNKRSTVSDNGAYMIRSFFCYFLLSSYHLS